MSDMHTAGIIAVAAAVTAVTRFLPFVLFNGKRKTPDWVLNLGKVLPSAIMAMLVVYCLKGVNVAAAPYGIPEFVSCIAVVVLHVLRRNTILSILGGTVLYMILVQLVF